MRSASSTTTIKGKVTNKGTDAPLANATVRLTGANTRTVTTDNAGLYSMTGLAPGATQIEVTLTGFAKAVIGAVVFVFTVVTLLAEVPRLAAFVTSLTPLDDAYDDSSLHFATDLPDPFEVLSQLQDNSRLGRQIRMKPELDVITLTVAPRAGV